jgi:MYND finger
MPGTDQYNENTFAERVRETLDIIAESPKEDENRIAMSGRFMPEFVHEHFGGPACHHVTVKQILDFYAEKQQSFLSMAEGNHLVMDNSEVSRLRERAYAGGKKCDCCGKTLAELQLGSFLLCERCEMVFYCNSECQKEAWKRKGHKQACRKPGQIEAGDDMLLTSVEFDDGQKRGVFVKAIACVDATTNVWQVQQYNSDRRIVEVMATICTGFVHLRLIWYDCYDSGW